MSNRNAKEFTKNKRVICGNTGTGKSRKRIAPVIRNNEKIILITANGIKDELNYMQLPEDILTIVLLQSIQNNHGKVAIDLENVSTVKKREYVIIRHSRCIRKRRYISRCQ